jgi:hypothetical protein
MDDNYHQQGGLIKHSKHVSQLHTFLAKMENAAHAQSN